MLLCVCERERETERERESVCVYLILSGSGDSRRLFARRHQLGSVLGGEVTGVRLESFPHLVLASCVQCVSMVLGDCLRLKEQALDSSRRSEFFLLF